MKRLLYAILIAVLLIASVTGYAFVIGWIETVIPSKVLQLAIALSPVFILLVWFFYQTLKDKDGLLK